MNGVSPSLPIAMQLLEADKILIFLYLPEFMRGGAPRTYSVRSAGTDALSPVGGGVSCLFFSGASCTCANGSAFSLTAASRSRQGYDLPQTRLAFSFALSTSS